MTLQELLKHLGEQVHYTDDHLGIDGDFEYKSCIIRKNWKGVYAVAELLKQDNTIIVAPIDRIAFKEQTGGTANG